MNEVVGRGGEGGGWDPLERGSYKILCTQPPLPLPLPFHGLGTSSAVFHGEKPEGGGKARAIKRGAVRLLFSQLAGRLYERFPRYFGIFYFACRCPTVTKRSHLYCVLSYSPHPLTISLGISRSRIKSFTDGNKQELASSVAPSLRASPLTTPSSSTLASKLTKRSSELRILVVFSPPFFFSDRRASEVIWKLKSICLWLN